jgi:hypothetical protein
VSSVLRLVHSAPSTKAEQAHIAIALGAARAMEEAETAFDLEISEASPDDGPKVAKLRAQRTSALRWLRKHFRERGVAFNAKGRPLLPGGTLRNVDLVEIHRAAIREALDAFSLMSEMFDLTFDGSFECLIEEAWQAQAVAFALDDDGLSVAVVVALDLKRGVISLSWGASRSAQVALPERYENELRHLLAEQHPTGWSRRSRGDST